MMAGIADDPDTWQVLSSETRYRNRWITLVEDTVLLPGEKLYTYTRLEPAGIGVGVVAFDDAGRILLEREYRHGVGEVIWQIPGGLAAEGESLQEAGLRELQEESGFAPAVVNDETVRYLGMVWDNPAYGKAASHIFAARGVVLTEGLHRDPGEYVSLHWVEPAWLKVAVASGEIRDRVVVAALAYLLLAGWVK